MYRSWCRWDSAFVVVNCLCAGLSMQLSARSAAIPKGRPVCLWLGNDSEWCAGALRFVYCTECTWHSVHLSSVHLYICCCDCCAFVVVIGLCADLGMQLSARTSVMPTGKTCCIVLCCKYGIFELPFVGCLLCTVPGLCEGCAGSTDCVYFAAGTVYAVAVVWLL